MSYLTGAGSECVGSAVCLKLGILAGRYQRRQKATSALLMEIYNSSSTAEENTLLLSLSLCVWSANSFCRKMGENIPWNMRRMLFSTVCNRWYYWSRNHVCGTDLNSTFTPPLATLVQAPLFNEMSMETQFLGFSVQNSWVLIYKYKTHFDHSRTRIW